MPSTSTTATQLWARVQAGEVRASYARHVCQDPRPTPERGGVRRRRGGRVRRRPDPLVPVRDPGRGQGRRPHPRLAREKEEQAAKATFAKKLRARPTGWPRSWSAPTSPPSTPSTPRSPPRPRPWSRPCPTPTDDERRVHAVLLLANPGAAPETDLADLLPTVQLYLHPYAGADAEPVARLEGHGPVTEAWITRVLGPDARFKITPSSTWPARHPSTPTRSPTDIDRPCTS